MKKYKDTDKVNNRNKIYLEYIKNIKRTINEKKDINLDKKYNECIHNYKNILKELECNTIKYEIENLNKFIDKMVVWYELKFPDSVVTNLFRNNDLILNTKFFNESKDPIYNTNYFFNIYLEDAKWYLKKPSYPNYLKLDENRRFHLSKKGIILEAENFYKRKYKNKRSSLKDVSYIFNGIHIANIFDVAMLENYDLKDEKNIIEKTINIYNNKVKAKEVLLDAVMYKIIKRGGNRIGPKRGLLFAKEFNRNIDIPMQYGIDTADYNDKNLIKVYLKNGGNRNLEMYVNYFYDNMYSFIFGVWTIDDYIKKYYSNDIDFYTKEELEKYKKELYTRMINTIDNRKNMLILSNKNTDK